MELAPRSHARHTDERPAGTPPGTEAFPHLFAPLMLRGRRLCNRIVMTAHTTCMGVDGIPRDRAAAYYAERARGGAGLIVLEPIPVHPTARVTPDNFTAQDPRYVPALGELAATVRGHGCALIQQLYHVGPYANPLASRRERWGPSPAQPLGAADRVHAMTRREIRELVTSFAAAAATVAAAELDGVEVLMGHDGLIDSFLSPLHNHRADEYGGPARNRLRLAREVLDAVRSAVGDRIVGVSLSGDHFSAGGLHADDCAEIAATLVEGHDVDYVAVTNAGYLAAHLIIPTMDVDQGFGGQFARAVKHALPGTPVLAQGRITTPQLAESPLAGGGCDLVGMTRALIADPQLPNKARTGRTAEIRPCIGCNQQCWGRRARQFFISCLQNPAVGFEHSLGLSATRPAAQPRNIVVVGGGPAGLEAARVAAERGHHVMLFEAADQLGGQALVAARMPRHAEFRGVINYRAAEIRRLGVTVRCGQPATLDQVAAAAPDMVVVAAGARPDRSGWQPALGAGVSCTDGVPVASPAEVLSGVTLPPGDVVILDGLGHRAGLAAAEWLAASGHAVTIVSANPVIGAELEPIKALTGYRKRLAALGVRLLPDTAVLAFDGERVLLRRLYDGVEHQVSAAALVMATPGLANDELATRLEEAGLPAVTIGDARAPRLLDAAIREGFEVARQL